MILQLQAVPVVSVEEAAAEAAGAAATEPGEVVEAAVQRFAALLGSDSTQLEPLRLFLHQALQYQEAAKVKGGERPPLPSLVLEPMADKDQRTAVHRLCRALPGLPKLETNTVDQPQPAQQQQAETDAANQGEEKQDGEQAGAAAPPPAQQQPAQQQAAGGSKPQCIELQVASSGGGGGGRGGSGGRGGGGGQKRKWRDDSGWAGGSQRYTKFVLYKENMDSQVGFRAPGSRQASSVGVSVAAVAVWATLCRGAQLAAPGPASQPPHHSLIPPWPPRPLSPLQFALNSLTKLLYVSHKLFSVAGTKDKRGVTVQQVCGGGRWAVGGGCLLTPSPLQWARGLPQCRRHCALPSSPVPRPPPPLPLLYPSSSSTPNSKLQPLILPPASAGDCLQGGPRPPGGAQPAAAGHAPGEL